MLAVAIASAQRGAQNSTHRRVVLVGDFPLFIYCIILYLQIVLGYYIYIYIYTKKKKKGRWWYLVSNPGHPPKPPFLWEWV